MWDEVAVGPEVLELAEKHNSVMLLNMHKQEDSRGKVFRWQGGWWTMTGGCYQGGQRLYITITQVVPEASYTGPAYNKELAGLFRDPKRVCRNVGFSLFSLLTIIHNRV